MIDYKAIEESTQALGTLSNAPIKEAVLAFYHSPNEAYDGASRIAVLKATFETYDWQGFSPVTVQTTFSHKEGQFESKAEHEVGVEAERFIGRSTYSNLILIVEREQFAVAMQAPYTNWLNFSSLAVELWIAFQAAFNVQAYNYGLRYINRLNLGLRLNEYLRPEQLLKPDHVSLAPINFTTEFGQAILGTPYAVRTRMQFEPSAPLDAFGEDLTSVNGALLLDIAILPLKATAQTASIEISLAQLRALKNLFFIGTLNPTVIEHYR